MEDRASVGSGRVKRLIARIFPMHFLRQFRFELHMLLVRMRAVRSYRRFKGAKGLMINIGCGPEGKPGWINIDGSRQPSVNCLYDARCRLPFPNQSVRAIFAEHFLEHLDYLEEVSVFLLECRRVLQPGGLIRIVVPDAEQYLNLYSRERDNWEPLKKLRPLGPDLTDRFFRYNTKMELINVVFRQYDEHKFAYDYETLEFVLKRAGFSSVSRRSYNQSSLPEACLDSEERASESLYAEAVK